MKNSNFGIEIEFTGISRGHATDILANYFSSEIQRESEKRTKVFDSLGRPWIITNDSSIKPSITDKSLQALQEEEDIFNSYRVELISPVLKYNELTVLADLIALFTEAGAVVNKSCGIHIHLDFVHGVDALKTLISMVYLNTPTIYKALGVETSRLRYCRKFAKVLVDRVNDTSVDTLEKLSEAWYTQYPNDEINKKYNRTRYYGLNLHSAFHKSTVEFRFFNSSLDITYIKAYLDFCLALSNYSLSNKEVEIVDTESSNTLQAFTDWLVSIGVSKDVSSSEISILSKGLQS